MHVTVEIPHQGSSLDAAIAKQFADIQRQLMELSKQSSTSKSEMHTAMLDSLAEQQDAFLKAMEQLMGVIQRTMTTSKTSDALASALQGLNETVASLPGDLKSSLASRAQARPVKAAPSKVTVALPERVTAQLDTLESALMDKPTRGFSHRTFGSNY